MRSFTLFSDSIFSNRPMPLGLLLITLFSLVMSQTSLADHSPTLLKSFEIQRGVVVVTPSFCPPDQCEKQRARFTGQLVAQIESRSITFTESLLSNSAGIDFQLPRDPALDSNGTTRQVAFRLKGKTLLVRGQINSSAFDGPIIDYQFIAKMQKGTPAQATTAYYRLENKGIFCITSPCFSYSVSLLNKNPVSEMAISRLDFPTDTALSEQVFDAQNRLGEGQSLIILGRIESYSGFAGPGRALRIKDWFITGRELRQ